MKFPAALATAAFLLVALTVLKESVVSAQSVTLRCVSDDGDNFGTVVSGEDGTTTPLLVYNGVPSPQQTCKDVTTRLNRVVSRSDIDLSSLLLRTGSIGKEDVICLVKNRTSACSSRNFVMDIPSDQNNPEKFLEQLIQGAETFVVGKQNDQTRSVAYAKFGQALKRAIPASK